MTTPAPAATPERVRLVEVGPRDGFQMESEFIPTELKVEVIDRIAAAGVTKIEATSFVHPKVIPQLRDAAEVLERIERRPRVSYTALVPNLKGLERAMAAGADGARLVVCASEAYNQRNVRLSIDESLEVCRAMQELAAPAGFPLEAVIGVAFGCPLAGAVSEDSVVALAHRFVDLGIREIAVADSVGLAHPRQVARLMGRLKRELAVSSPLRSSQGDVPLELSLHLHDTRGLGLANVLAALGEGIDTFDASIGGLGGCPVVPGGFGNISSEDLVNMCEEMGIATGVDLAGIRRASHRLRDFLKRDLPSRVLAAGTRGELFAQLEARS